MIELKIDDFRDGKVTFHISHQDEEDYKRLRNEPFYLKFSDGRYYCLFSSYYPDYCIGELFVRGKDSSMDNKKIVVTFTDFLRIFELLKEYNA